MARQLYTIRNLAGDRFDFLAAVLFTKSYGVLRGALVPRAVIERRASLVPGTNAYKFFFDDDIWDTAGIQDVTKRLRDVNL